MNENPEGTPNPLNSGSAPEAPVVTPSATPVEPGAETAQAVDATPASSNEASLDPSGRVMEQATVADTAEEKPKKKTGLIAGIIIGAVLLIGGGVAAAIALINMNSVDPVTAAMNKIMSGELPNTVLVDGTVSIVVNDEESPVDKINIDLNSGIMQKPMVNTSTAVITLSLKKLNDISFEFDEVYAESGDLYIKLDGAADAIEQSDIMNYLNSGSSNVEVTDCTTDENGNEICETDLVVQTEDEYTDMDESFNTVISLIETIDGDWIRISTDELTSMTEGFSETNVSCVTDMVSEIKKDQTALELYKKYPFVLSDSKEITIQKKNDPIFKVSLDSENFANFVNSIQNSSITQKIYTCFDIEDSVTVDEETINEITSNFPQLYTEVNGDHNFTRLYLESDAADGSYTTIIDLSFTYPTSINVGEPEDYVDFSTVLETIFDSMYEEDAVVEVTE